MSLEEVEMSVTAVQSSRYSVRWAWLAGWAIVTVAVVALVVRGGVVGSVSSVLLAVAAVLAFVAPDLTFLVGAGQPVQRGYLPVRAVPYYNAMHRLWGPLATVGAATLTLAAWPSVASVLLVAGLSWAAHVVLDRAAGYGLRNSDGSR